jgi:hypothetical protein
VKVGDAWYVVDITYTTPESPVEVSEYAEHLKALSKLTRARRQNSYETRSQARRETCGH